MDTDQIRRLYDQQIRIGQEELDDHRIHFLTVDASDMSRPILEKISFRLIALSHPCQWMCDCGSDV